MPKSKKMTIIVLLLIAVLIAVIPLFVLKGAAFGGSDDAGSQTIEEITGSDYQPWFTPVLEKWMGGEIPGEVESLMFCLQTGIGAGVLFFFLGRYVEKTKWEKKLREKENQLPESIHKYEEDRL
ncbi:cobalt ABC transporter [Acetobacterium fimetarium]|uniref:Cobalt transport protein CbiN n=1 Tax=Acetobacterium fimetarium TaxID=52691 RepID=A0ABR6WSV4_9FIRM|nr:cobalt transport protein CbiN [Acetobacterium fimetarium]MBC3803627.1 cobalt ABC transporter [Acetobacterium fimetarium]